MGNPKQKWSSEEEEALRAGVRKHGTGKWKNIQRDPEFYPLLSSRSNIDLKDKWRNLTVGASNGSIPRDKWRTQKPKPNPDVSAAPFPIVFRQPPPPTPPSSATHRHDASTDVIDDTSSCKIDLKTASKYDAMIYEALSEVNDLNGSDISTIVSLIEKKHDIGPNFRRLVGPRLRRLVALGKLEKVDNSYRMKGLIKPPPPPLSPKSRDLQSRQVQSPGYGDTLDEASVKAAAWIADIENKSFAAAEAVKEAERVSRMSEDADAFLDFANDIFERSLFGRIVLMA